MFLWITRMTVSNLFGGDYMVSLFLVVPSSLMELLAGYAFGFATAFTLAFTLALTLACTCDCWAFAPSIMHAPLSQHHTLCKQHKYRLPIETHRWTQANTDKLAFGHGPEQCYTCNCIQCGHYNIWVTVTWIRIALSSILLLCLIYAKMTPLDPQYIYIMTS